MLVIRLILSRDMGFVRVRQSINGKKKSQHIVFVRTMCLTMLLESVKYTFVKLIGKENIVSILLKSG